MKWKLLNFRTFIEALHWLVECKNVWSKSSAGLNESFSEIFWETSKFLDKPFQCSQFIMITILMHVKQGIVFWCGEWFIDRFDVRDLSDHHGYFLTASWPSWTLISFESWSCTTPSMSAATFACCFQEFHERYPAPPALGAENTVVEVVVMEEEVLAPLQMSYCGEPSSWFCLYKTWWDYKM